MGFSSPTLVNPKYLRPRNVKEAYIRQGGENRYYCPAKGKILYVKWGRDAVGANTLWTIAGPGATEPAGIECQQATRDSYIAYNGKDPATEPRPRREKYAGGGKASWAGRHGAMG